MTSSKQTGARAPGRPKPGDIPTGDRPTYPSGEGLSHTTVLLREAVESLVTTPDGTYLDGTFGRGGHTRLLLSHLSPQGRVVAIDRDPEAVIAASAGNTRVDDPRFSIHHAPFAQMAHVIAEAATSPSAGPPLAGRDPHGGSADVLVGRGAVTHDGAFA